MALGFGSYARMERKLLKTRNILGEGDPVFRENNKIQALQFAASVYNLYSGNGSEVTYDDVAGLNILQSEMIATRAALELTISAISYYKDDVVKAQAAVASAEFRQDKLAWLQELEKQLKDNLDDLEQINGFSVGDGLNALLLEKIMACCDPPEDVCPDQALGPMNGEAGI